MKRVTLFSGHYGSGKTNIAVNYALGLKKEGLKTLIADLDIVNPYFRTRDSEKALKDAGVEIVVSSYANTNVDVPALPEEMYRIIDDKQTHAVVDVGGDDRGALALGRLAPSLMAEDDYEMVFVMNFYRPLTRTADQLISVLREVETASGMKVTALLNNSNLGQMTAVSDIAETDALAREVSEKTNLPLLGTTVREDLINEIKGKVVHPMPIRLHFRDEWAIY
ncbi:MAG: hypothetical protein IJN21_07655 [Clostridia bacterium]|nr:hypothetical protein [Clostridiales bacterium]MBQ3232232.1 hypothetical protein [Clostridia bacterium]MBQ6716377.1 hypothetical protein [Clostridia bacterium]